MATGRRTDSELQPTTRQATHRLGESGGTSTREEEVERRSREEARARPAEDVVSSQDDDPEVAAGDGQGDGADDRSRLATACVERADERRRLAERLHRNGIEDRRVLEALAKVPRHVFVPPEAVELAYEDIALPLARGQTVSQPFVVASMTEQARVQPGDRCLEIGTGSGYQAAVLAELGALVFSIEVLPDLHAASRRTLRALGYEPERVRLRRGDGSLGWPEEAPFDAILVTAAPARVPEPLLRQVKQGGRLVIPVGDRFGWQQLEVWQRLAPGEGPGAFHRTVLYGVRFVPLVTGDGNPSP